MKRRNFLTLSALSAASLPVIANGENENLEHTWHETITTDALKFRAVSDEGNLTLDVELILAPEDEITEILDESGEHECFRYQGKNQPYPFHPGCTVLSRFDFSWDGKAIPVPARFWDDLPGFRIEVSTLDPATLNPELRWKAEEFLAGLRQPKVILSADGGTALVEWERPEECDSRSTLRWIISKSGTVLRHRHQPPHDC